MRAVLGASLIIVYVILLLLYFTELARADELFELDKLAIQTTHMFEGSRSLLVPKLSEELAFKLDVNLLQSVFVRNNVHGSMSGPYFAAVGWEYQVGVKPFSWAEVSFYHHSQHWLDQAIPQGSNFPLANGIMLELNLLGREPHGPQAIWE